RSEKLAAFALICPNVIGVIDGSEVNAGVASSGVMVGAATSGVVVGVATSGVVVGAATSGVMVGAATSGVGVAGIISVGLAAPPPTPPQAPSLVTKSRLNNTRIAAKIASLI
ncbi:MAG: hypothetical protein OSA94_08040, partial [Yoonia sp.]|nr:hypothetical protein [Yoonia sp.]